MSDLDMWPRIRQAIYATTISREAVEFEWPDCHRKNCGHRHGNPNEAFRHIIDKVAETVYVELLCRNISDPPAEDDE